jgi:hypothetical protein
MSLLDKVLNTDEYEWRSKFWFKPSLFRDFVESKEHLRLPPLSERQYQAIFKLIGEDPLKVFTADRKKHIGVYLLGKGCVSEDTIIRNEITGEERTIKQLCDANSTTFLKCFDQIENTNKVVESGVPYLKGMEELFEVTLENGKTIKVSKEHRFLTKNGWRVLAELKEGDEIVCEK